MSLHQNLTIPLSKSINSNLLMIINVLWLKRSTPGLSSSQLVHFWLLIAGLRDFVIADGDIT